MVTDAPLPQALAEFVANISGKGRWISIQEAARLANTSADALRARIMRLDKVAGGGLIRKHGPGKWARYDVNIDAVRAYHRTSSHLSTNELDQLREQVVASEAKIDALRRMVLELRAALH